jgi:hypothetical protein
MVCHFGDIQTQKHFNGRGGIPILKMWKSTIMIIHCSRTRQTQKEMNSGL